MGSVEVAVVKSQGRKPILVFTRSASATPPERRGSQRSWMNAALR